LLARIGPAAIESIPAIKELLKGNENDSDEETELRIVIAVTCISGDRTEFQRRFELALQDRTDDGWRARSKILNLFEGLGANADFFMDEIASLIQFASSNRKSDQYTLGHGLRLLGIVRSSRAIELLKTFQSDRDWQIRSEIKRLLEAIEDGVE
jgi:hypothetical protein